MLLSAYAWKVNLDSVIDDFNFSHNEVLKYEEIFNWHNHTLLHDWMYKLYKSKGGTEEDFNCIPVRLYMKDLNNLDFDFSNFPHDVSLRQRDAEFIKIAKQTIESGFALYYDSWF